MDAPVHPPNPHARTIRSRHAHHTLHACTLHTCPHTKSQTHVSLHDAQKCVQDRQRIYSSHGRAFVSTRQPCSPGDRPFPTCALRGDPQKKNILEYPRINLGHAFCPCTCSSRSSTSRGMGQEDLSRPCLPSVSPWEGHFPSRSYNGSIIEYSAIFDPLAFWPTHIRILFVNVHTWTRGVIEVDVGHGCIQRK